MAEQLSMEFSAETAESTEPTQPEAEAYEALDFQLADLMQELNTFRDKDEAEQKTQNKVIRRCTLEISKHTREGQIAIPIAAEDQAVLLQTNVGGEAEDYKPLIIDQGYLYLRRYWKYQQRLAQQICTRMTLDEAIDSQPDQELKSWAQQRLDEYFPQQQGDTNWQRRAAELALKHQFLIVSGGPGTGKTTTITRLLALLIEQHLKQAAESDQEKSAIKVGGVLSRSFTIHLAAPTGKAAIRMLDSIREAQAGLKVADQYLNKQIAEHMPSEASTLHKLLGYRHGSVQFKHNTENPLRADVVLVDEASMIDIALMTKLVEAVPAHAKLILIGDKDQLSSVETGSVFTDMCRGLENDASEHLVTLKKNWRFAEDSDIGQSALAANRGDSATLLQTLQDQKRTGCELLAPQSMRDADLIKPLQQYFELLNNPDASHAEIFAVFNQYRILCALRRGINGSVIMNSRIETALAKQGLIKLRRSAALAPQQRQAQSGWYHGRPVMITQNSYSKGLFNGDTGITLVKDGEIKVYFQTAEGSSQSENGAFKSFAPVRLPVHETTWAMTIHKSQGSEFDQVVLILPQEEMPLLTRQLVYTGITRAKQKVSIVASEAVLKAGVKAEVVSATRISKKLYL